MTLTVKEIETVIEKHSRAMQRIERIWGRVEAELCEQAGDDRTCEAAIASAAAGMMKHKAMALHREADMLAAQFAGARVARAGDR